MPLFTIPAIIAAKVEKIMSDFRWSSNKPSFHLVNWDDVFRSKHEGAIGIRCLREMNEALKAKWLWRFANEKDATWKKVIVMKYEVDDFS